MQEKLIIDKLVSKLQEIEDATVISSSDFTEERDNNMVVIGIENREQINFALPDYKYTISIVIDTFIDDDEQGELFKKTKQEVVSFFQKYINREEDLSQLFDDIPAVGLLQGENINTIDEKSNRCELNFSLIISE